MKSKAVLHSIVTLASVGFVASMAASASAAGAPGKTREQVRAELAEWTRNPVTTDGVRFVGGEVGFVYDERAAASSALGSGTGAKRGLTRAQVRQELLEFQRNPVSADGYWRYTGGETGWVPLGAAFERRDGTWVRVR